MKNIKLLSFRMLLRNWRTGAPLATLASKFQAWAVVLMLLLTPGQGVRAEANAKAVSDTLELSVDTDRIVGNCYRFWGVKVETSQHGFSNPGYAERLRDVLPYANSVNCVRLLGGRPDRLNEWYKGVDAGGNVLADFSGLMPELRALVGQGIEPRLVLDNVPFAMSIHANMEIYGNTMPPDDYGVWRQYIADFARSLVAEFGLEKVRAWRFRVGTEPDLYPRHWAGTREQYFRHYDETVKALSTVIPGARISPGNILNPAVPPKRAKPGKEQAGLVGHGGGWGLDIIDHVGKTGAPMATFSFSYYGMVGRENRLEECMRLIRERLERYPALKSTPVNIEEFGVLIDEHGKRLWGGDMTEWGASWYASVADSAYRLGISDIYEWGSSTAGLPHPRQHVMHMLEKMACGKRLEVSVKGRPDGEAGVIACAKDGKIFLLLYNHQPARLAQKRRDMSVRMKGSMVAKTPSWTIREWSVDRDHGGFVYSLYRHCEKAGLKPLPDSALYDGQVQRRFGDQWRTVLEKNRAQYERQSQLPRTRELVGVIFALQDAALCLEFDMPAHAVKLVEMEPVSMGAGKASN